MPGRVHPRRCRSQVGQLEWFLPEREKLVDPDGAARRFAGTSDPWATADKPPVAIVGSGPAGLINAYLLAAEGFPVTVFEAFHALGGVLRYGIPEFRLPNDLIDDVVGKIKLLGGRFVPNFVVGKTATIEDLRDAGFWKIFVGTGAGLPRFMNVPGRALLNVMSANEFLTRVEPDAGPARRLRDAAAARPAASRCWSSAAATPRWTPRAPPDASAAR